VPERGAGVKTGDGGGRDQSQHNEWLLRDHASTVELFGLASAGFAEARAQASSIHSRCNASASASVSSRGTSKPSTSWSMRTAGAPLAKETTGFRVGHPYRLATDAK